MVHTKRITKEDLEYTPVPIFDCIYCVRHLEDGAYLKNLEYTMQQINSKFLKSTCEKIKEEQD